MFDPVIVAVEVAAAVVVVAVIVTVEEEAVVVVFADVDKFKELLTRSCLISGKNSIITISNNSC